MTMLELMSEVLLKLPEPFLTLFRSAWPILTIKKTVGLSRSSVKGQIISCPNLNQPFHIGINASYPSEAISGHLGHPPAPFLHSKIRPI